MFKFNLVISIVSFVDKDNELGVVALILLFIFSIIGFSRCFSIVTTGL